MKVFLVYAESGSYGEYSKRNVIAFLKEESARDFVLKAQDEDKRLRNLWGRVGKVRQLPGYKERYDQLKAEGALVDCGVDVFETMDGPINIPYGYIRNQYDINDDESFDDYHYSYEEIEVK